MHISCGNTSTIMFSCNTWYEPIQANTLFVMGNFSEKVKEQELLTNPKKRKIGLLPLFIQVLGIKLNNVLCLCPDYKIIWITKNILSQRLALLLLQKKHQVKSYVLYRKSSSNCVQDFVSFSVWINVQNMPWQSTISQNLGHI